MFVPDIKPQTKRISTSIFVFPARWVRVISFRNHCDLLHFNCIQPYTKNQSSHRLEQQISIILQLIRLFFVKHTSNKLPILSHYSLPEFCPGCPCLITSLKHLVSVTYHHFIMMICTCEGMASLSSLKPHQ